MKNLFKNPVILILLTFFISSCIFAYFNLLSKIIITILSSLLVITLLVVIRNTTSSNGMPRTAIFVMVGIIIAGVLSSLAFDFGAKNIDNCSSRRDKVTIRITECDYSLSYIARYTAVIEASELIPSGTNILFTSEKIGLSHGTLLSGEIEYSSLSDMNTGSFDAKRYYLPKKIMISAEDISTEITGISKKFNARSFFGNLNERLCAKITAHSSYSSAGLQAAVLLGNKDYLTDSVSRDFRRLGITHLLVVSGTHFSIIVSLIERALRRLMINKRYRALLNMMFTVFFMALMGFSPSVTRAGIMCLIAQLAQLISRKACHINSLAFAGALMILINPYLALDCGMQMSFIATYACIVFTEYKSYLILKARGRRKNRIKSRGIRRILRGITETIILTTFVNILMLPITWIYFGEISLMAIPANVIFMPAITILMYLSGLYLIVYPLRIFIIPLTSFIDWYCGGLESLASIMAKPNFSLVAINYKWSIFFIVPICLIIFIFPFIKRKHIKAFGITALALLAAFTASVGLANALDYDNVRISYVSEKKNEGLVIKTNGKVMLCDFSDASSGFSYELLEEMSALHVCEVDTLMLTHYHSKHVKLFGRISEREIVRNLVLPEPITDNEYLIYDTLYKNALTKGIRVFTVSPEDAYLFGDAEIVLFERKYISRSTHPITAIQITAHGEVTTYASSSFNQAGEEITASIEASEHVILGKHSPVYKKKYALSFDDEIISLVICSDAVEYMDTGTKAKLDSLEHTTDTELYRIVIRKEE